MPLSVMICLELEDGFDSCDFLVPCDSVEILLDVQCTFEVRLETKVVPAKGQQLNCLLCKLGFY